MSLPTILFAVYLALGLLFAFVSLFSQRKKGIQDPTGSLGEPAIFWLYLLLWPVMALFWFSKNEEEKRKERRRAMGAVSPKDKKA